MTGRPLDRRPDPIMRALRLARIDQGVTQLAAARAAGCSQAYIGRIERGLVDPPLSVVRALDALYGTGLIPTPDAAPVVLHAQPAGRSYDPYVNVPSRTRAEREARRGGAAATP